MRIIWTTAAALVGLWATGALAQEQGSYHPAPTLAQEIASTHVPLVNGYAQKHPRLLYSSADIPALKEKSQKAGEMWKAVLASARRLGDAAPDPETIRTGKTYWRIEGVQSASLAYALTGDKTHLERAARWMVAHCAQDVWGTGFRSNLDLQASWYLYHIAIAYDSLYNDLAPSDRDAIRKGLALHAKAIYESLAPDRKDPFTYDQNHLYIPTVALAASSLALLDDVPESADWLKRACAIMQRCRYVMGNDGWYFEGPGYWSYALHWHARYADLMHQATGQNLYDLPALKENWRFALFTSLPTAPSVFDVGDINTFNKDQTRGDFNPTNYSMLWGVAGALKSGQSRAVADMLYARAPERDYPAAAFLWFDPSVPATPLSSIKPYHNFSDLGFVAWRSGWNADDTAYLFRMGPPEGHAALAKLGEMKDWRMNAGHVHADIGSFWIYAKGSYLATDTGYTAEKWTKDQNTILIDGIGQAMDGEYHNEHGYPPQELDQVRLDNVYLSDAYAFASGEYGSAYPEPKVGALSLRRSALFTRRWLLVIDDLSGQRDHKLTWICHADSPFTREGDAILSHQKQASLAVIPVTGPAAPSMDEKLEPCIVIAGTAPGAGKPTQRGFQLTRTSSTPARTHRLIHLLAVLGPNEKPPQAKLTPASGKALALTITQPNSASETIMINNEWLSGPAAKTTREPASFKSQ